MALFRREARQITLTDAGATYLVEIQGALQRIRNASLQASSHGAERAVHLASLPTFAARWLMTLWVSASSSAARVKLRCRAVDSKASNQDMDGAARRGFIARAGAAASWRRGRRRGRVLR